MCKRSFLRLNWFSSFCKNVREGGRFVFGDVKGVLDWSYHLKDCTARLHGIVEEENEEKNKNVKKKFNFLRKRFVIIMIRVYSNEV